MIHCITIKSGNHSCVWYFNGYTAPGDVFVTTAYSDNVLEIVQSCEDSTVPSLLAGQVLDGGSCRSFTKAVGHFRIELEPGANEHRDAVQDEHGARIPARHDQHGGSEAQGKSGTIVGFYSKIRALKVAALFEYLRSAFFFTNLNVRVSAANREAKFDSPYILYVTFASTFYVRRWRVG